MRLYLYFYLYLFTILVLGILATSFPFSWKWCPSIHPIFLCKSQAPYPRISNMITDFHALWGNLSCGDLIPMRQMYQNVWEVIDPDRPFRTDIFPNREVIQSGVGSSWIEHLWQGKRQFPYNAISFTLHCALCRYVDKMRCNGVELESAILVAF